MRNRVIITLAAAGLALAAGVGTAAEASAATPSPLSASARSASPDTVRPAIVSGCSATYFCFWNNENFNDGPGKLSGNNGSWYAFSHSSCPGGSWANCASSLDNAGTSGDGVDVYSGLNYSGVVACIPDNATYSDLANYDYPGTSVNMNDTIESNEWTHAC